jgi:LPXTG-site transpeptidase (sortase) family protein
VAAKDFSRRRHSPLLVLVSLLMGAASVLLLVVALRFFSAPEVRSLWRAWLPAPLVRQVTYPLEAAAPAAAGGSRHDRPRWTGLPAVAAVSPPEPAAAIAPSPDPLQGEPPPILAPSGGPSAAPPVPAQQPTPRPPVVPNGRLLIDSLEMAAWPARMPLAGDGWDIAGLGEGVGWLEATGAFPGDRYAMVFIGHVTLPAPGGEGPFLRLRELEVGDEIVYRTPDALYTYRVESAERVAPEEVERLFQADGQSLILVTCAEWNLKTRQYDRRLLVQARLVRTEHLQGAFE